MHNEIRVAKEKQKNQFNKDPNTKDQNFHCLEQEETRSHFLYSVLKLQNIDVLLVDRVKLNMCKFWLSVFDLCEKIFSYTLVINQIKLRL